MKKIPCERYSRVVGYMRPVCQWNPGKQAEFDDRRPMDAQALVEKVRGESCLLSV